MSAKGIHGATPERLALAAEAQRLRAGGLLLREIQERLGISYSYAQQLVDDPDGAKARARKDSYAGTCQTCGAMTTGSDGVDAAPDECATCAAIRRHAERYWTAGRIIATFQAFAAEHGRSPRALDAHGTAPSFDGRYSLERLAELDDNSISLPAPQFVAREFGSWAAALQAAGLPTSRGGHPSHRTPFYRTEARREIARLLAERPRTIRELSAGRAIRRDSMTATVAAMLRAGLVEQATPAHGRGAGNGRGLAPATWRLTPEGQRRLLP